MKVAVLGAGYTGLTAALRLLQAGHEVILFEKSNNLGGLAQGFKDPAWEWSLEKHYHHWFTNDNSILNLAKELDQKVLIVRPQTSVWVNNQGLPFDSPLSVLTFPYLSLISRLRTGVAVLYLKLIGNYKKLEKQKALPWIKKFMGEEVSNLIWEPLFSGKFSSFKDEVILSWFWARIKKRTPSLAYPEGGFASFTQKLADKVEDLGGKIFLNSEILSLDSSKNHCVLKTKGKTYTFDRVISTLPSPVFAKVATGLPQDYVKKIAASSHLHALNLILVLKKPFLQDIYWLNITDSSFPFLVLAEHTNFVSLEHYGNQHILYIGNYLPEGHPYLKMTPQDLLKTFDPYLKRINPSYHRSLITTHLFVDHYAQPVMAPGYVELIASLQSPLKNVLIANMAMVYPWDRGTNYAVEMGEKVAKMVDNEAS